MGVPNSLDTMDRIECSAVYIDHRVSAERWVYQSPSESAASATGSNMTLPDEPESLQADLQLLLEVCKRSMFGSLCPGRMRLVLFSFGLITCSLPVQCRAIPLVQTGGDQRKRHQLLRPDFRLLRHRCQRR